MFLENSSFQLCIIRQCLESSKPTQDVSLPGVCNFACVRHCCTQGMGSVALALDMSTECFWKNCFHFKKPKSIKMLIKK